jgi:hypothetical protein
MATAVVNGIRMHYRRIGEGSPIVLLQIYRREDGRWKVAHRHAVTLPWQTEPEAARDHEGTASAGER